MTKRDLNQKFIRWIDARGDAHCGAAYVNADHVMTIWEEQNETGGWETRFNLCDHSRITCEGRLDDIFDDDDDECDEWCDYPDDEGDETDRYGLWMDELDDDEDTPLSFQDTIDSLRMSNRAANALKRAGIYTVAQLRQCDIKSLTRAPGIGKKTAKEIEYAVERSGK